MSDDFDEDVRVGLLTNIQEYKITLVLVNCIAALAYSEDTSVINLSGTEHFSVQWKCINVIFADHVTDSQSRT